MRPRITFALFLLCAASIAVLQPISKTKRGVTPRPSVASQSQVQQNYGKLPLAFEANRGQTDGRVKFISRGSGYTMFLTGDEAVLALKKPSVVSGPLSAVGTKRSRAMSELRRTKDIGGQATNSALRIKLVGANPEAKSVGLDELPGKSNYFIGNDPKKWRANVPNFRRVGYKDVYPGIDLVYYGNLGRLEHDFVVSPGADPSAIKLALEGAESLSMDKSGNLVAKVSGGEVVLNKPAVYQRTVDNPKSKIENPKSVDGRFVLAANNQITFEVGPYDKTRPLVIDPVLSYATYLGGSAADYAFGIAVDSLGNAYIVGQTYSANFPALMRPLLSCDSTACPGDSADAFVVKLSADGSAVLYSTYLGGTGSDVGYGLAVDITGSAYVTGATSSVDFPTSANAFQKTKGSPVGNAFVTKLNPNGSLQYSTYLGGSGSTYGDAGFSLAIDAMGSAYVTGQTDSPDFPTKNALQAAFGGGTSCGGGGFFFRRNAEAAPEVSGGGTACPDAFITKMAPDGSSLIYSTYVGKTGEDYGMAISVDSTGNAYVGGYTNSADFPTHNPLQATLAGDYDGFVLKLNSSGSAMLFSTFLGGTGREYLQTITLDPQNDILIVGATASTDFPTVNPFQPANAGLFDAFLAKMNSSGSSMAFSTYFGGSDFDNALVVTCDQAANIYVVGVTKSSNFPLQHPIQDHSGGGADMFIAQFPPTGGAPTFSTYLGGSADDAWTGGAIAVDSSQNIYVTGDTSSTDFPTVNALNPTSAGVPDIFVAKISPQVAPTVIFAPKPLSFPDQVEGTKSAVLGSTLTNGGTQALTISSITLSSGTDYAQTNDCPISPATLAGGAHCTLSVTFAPTTTGTLTDEVVVASDATTSPDKLNLTGNGTAPESIVTPSPSSLPFSDQLVNTTSSPMTVSVTNTGTAALLITSIASTTGDFAQTNNCPLSPSPVAINGHCTITVTFSPSTRGSLTGSINIIDNAPDSPQSIPLSGKGVIAAAVQLSATTLPFGNQLLGSTSAAQTVTLTNSGDQDLTISSIAASGDFSQTNTCGTTVGGGLNCTISVTFKPTAAGVRDSTLTITDNASGNPHTVTLKGTGTDYTLGAASGSSTSQTVTAGNAATYNLAFTPNGASGTLALSCAGAPVGATCTVNPNSLPLTATSAATASVSVTTTAKTSQLPTGGGHYPTFTLRPLHLPWGVPLAGLLLLAILTSLAVLSRTQRNRQVAAPAWTLAALLLVVGVWAACGGENRRQELLPAVGLSATNVTFSLQNMNSTSAPQAVTLTNTGSGALSITSMTVTGANGGDFTQTNTCGSSVQVGGNCQINVTFSPTATGTRAGSVSIVDNAQGSPQSITLSGNGVPPVTPAGTYPLTVSATLTSGTSTLTHTLPLTLTVN